MPLFADFIFLERGHDTDFHMQRIAAVAEELQNHQFPVRIMTNMLNGYGYVNPLFYCDIFLYLPAVLYNFMLPLRTCYQIYVILVNLLTSVIGYYVFSKMTHSRQLGFVGSAVYVLSSYRLINIYVRAAVGEYTAMCFLPLVVYGLWRIYGEEKITWKEWLPLSIAMTGIIHCHILTVEMAALFVFLFALVNIRKTLTFNRLCALIKAVFVTIGLSAWFVVPFLESMNGMSINVNERINKIQATGTYPIQLFGLFIHGNGKSVRGGMQNEMPLSIGIVLVLGIVISIYVCLKRRQWKLEDKLRYKVLRVSFIFASIALLMTSKYFPYDKVENTFGVSAAKIIGAVQFSWRYLSIVTVLLSVTVVMALSVLNDFKPNTYKIAVRTLMCSELLFIGIFYWQYTYSASEYSFYSNDNRSQTMYIGAGEYLLKDTDTTQLSTAKCEMVSGELEVYAYERRGGKASIVCKNAGNMEAKVLLPIFHYDNYHIYDVDTGEEYPIETGDNNRIQIAVDAGYDGTLEVVYRAPFSWRAAEVVSLISIIVVAVMIMVDLLSKNTYNYCMEKY